MSSETSLPKLTSKACTKCNAEKPLSDYYDRKGEPNGQTVCKVCWLARCRERYAANRTEISKKNRKRLYGLDAETYEDMLSKQEGRCAICVTDAPGGRGWNVDHDHISGGVRSLLCHSCNTGLGSFKDIPALLRRAADYLEHHGSAYPR